MTRDILLLEELEICPTGKIAGKKVVIAALEQGKVQIQHTHGGSSAHRRQTCNFTGSKTAPAYCYNDFAVRLKL